MNEYHDLLTRILNEGVRKDDRTGTGTLSIFGDTRRYDLAEGFPLVTTKKVHWRSVVYELLWFIKGDTNVKYLNDNGVTIWNEWADKDGNLGTIYGFQWRTAHRNINIEDDGWCGECESDYDECECDFDNGVPIYIPDREIKKSSIYRTFGDEILDETSEGRSDYFDQLGWVINEIKTNPNSRRLIVNSWNVVNIHNGAKGMRPALPPCHVLFQFNVTNGRLNCMLYQRSGDAFLGVPFNIASYALLTIMIAQICGLQAGELIHTIADAHIYLNHLDQVNLQLSREPYPLPTLRLNPSVLSIDDFQYEDIELVNYVHHPAIKAPVAI